MDLRDMFEDAILDASGRINDSTEWRCDYWCKPTVMEDLLDKLGSITNEWCKSQIVQAGKAVDYWSKLAGTSVTCVGCPLSGTCEFAWDLQNTDGDCLAEK